MKPLYIVMLVAALLLTAVPAFAVCQQSRCLVSPCVCLLESGDIAFSDTSCSLWSFAGTATRSSSGSQYYGEIAYGTGNISQQVWGGATGTQVELMVDVTINPTTPGNEKLYIEVRSTGGTLLETLDVISGYESSGPRSYITSGYNANVILRFRRATSISDGSTGFQVDNANFWVCGN
jgi:hypothetical protein